MSTPLLGVHLIVKDEEDCLERCLRSIAPIADELIVADTGSTDGTPEIARSFGAQVHAKAWEDDFASARNFILSRATTEWILIMDADEQVADGAESLRDFLIAAKSDVCSVEIENRYGEQSWEKIHSRSVRLFRRKLGLRFDGAIHEQLVLPDRSAAPPASPSPLKLRHDGYMPGVIERKKKAERNLRILEKLLGRQPDDPFHLYNLGVTHCQLHDPGKAAELFTKSLAAAPEKAAYRPTLVRDYAKALIELARWDDAAELLHIECYRYSDYADLHHLAGEALERLGRLPEAFDSYRHASEQACTDGMYIIEAGIGSYRTLRAMARIARRLDDPERADALLRACLAACPGFEPALSDWADLLHGTGTPDARIAELLLQAANGRANDSVRLSEQLVAIGAYTEGLSLLKAANEQDSAARRLLVECLLQTGQFREACERIYGLEIEALPPDERRMRLIDMALCRWSERLELPFRFYKRLTAEEQQTFERLELLMQCDGGAGSLTVPGDLTLARAAVDRAVRLNLIRVADSLARLSAALAEAMPKLLYRRGYALIAADRFLALLGRGELDAEGLYMLAEIVYDKGHYEQAAPMFEEVLLQSPGHRQARIAASLCYLRLARQVLLESMERAPGHSVFQTDLQRIDASICMLNAAEWHTPWNAAERRNRDAAPPGIALHDR